MSDDPQVSRVVDLVSYQADAIVSRIVLKRDAGNDHHGRLAVSHRYGETMLMPAHQPHAVKAVSRFKMLLTMIRS